MDRHLSPFPRGIDEILGPENNTADVSPMQYLHEAESDILDGCNQNLSLVTCSISNGPLADY
jgi:hypothetical protein